MKNIILFLICSCIFISQDILLKTILGKPILSSFKTKNTIQHEIAWWVSLIVIFISSVIITAFIERKIPRKYLIFAFLISLGFLVIIIYANLKLISPQ